MRAVRFSADETFIGETWVFVEHVAAVHDGAEGMRGTHVYLGEHIPRLSDGLLGDDKPQQRPSRHGAAPVTEDRNAEARAAAEEYQKRQLLRLALQDFRQLKLRPISFRAALLMGGAAQAYEAQARAGIYLDWLNERVKTAQALR